RKANVPEATYFVTLTGDSWVDVFTRKELVDELLKSIRYCQDNKGLELFAYVIMSNHAHFVMRRTEGLLADLLRDFKSYTAKQLLHLIATLPNESRSEWLLRHFNHAGLTSAQNKKFAFWKKDSHPIELYTSEVFDQKVEYIHMNPVISGLVSEPAHYLLSSAHDDGPLV
ncbi:MAG: REP-associated tyrosine transposase, partial [Flavobacteriales bacterium]